MRGMGRIFQRGSVFWIAYSFRGKEYRESTHSDKENVATKLLKKRLGEIGRGRLIGPIEEKVTFEEMAADLERDYTTNGKRSADTMQCKLQHLRRSFTLMRAIDITTDRIRTHIATRQEAGAKNASINRELSALKRMFTLAVQANRLSSRPYIPMLEENNARQGFVDHAAFLALRGALPDYLQDAVTFLYLSGWRISEMRGLEWRDVDLAGRVVRLRPELSKNKSGRVLPLSGDLLEVIERAAEQRRPDCVRVFHSEGEPVGDIRKSWWKASVAARLGAWVSSGKFKANGEPELKYKGLTPHDLRRSAVRNMVRAGIPERVCMALSGHKTRAIFDRYNIVSESDLTAAADRLQEHIESQPTTARVVPLRSAKQGA
ncbi:MAG: tyrosine-type recombinase/integrase [Deltaproteobacteria bacterium]|nr:tyrosine-type recombinase/integrase [Deltaproteobacteria bacterium]